MIAPPVPRLFANTPLSVWNWFLTEALHRPLRSVPRQLSMLDFDISPGTLGDSVKRLVPLFAPLGDAIAEHQAAARIAHGDETGWRVHARGEEGENPRSWLWVCQTPDAVRMIVDPSRSAAAAWKLFGSLGIDEPLVCDRYSAEAGQGVAGRARLLLGLCCGSGYVAEEQ